MTGPVSTGRESAKFMPLGAHTFTSTPAGYYELDPQRMYRRYHSDDWDQSMPYAMFFNWERRACRRAWPSMPPPATTSAKLGSRASAGCVHLAPENARCLFNLIRSQYRGPVPRFAYDQDGQTMSNQGALDA